MSREILDFYETPPWMTRFLLKNHEITGRVVCPCAGDLSIPRVLRDVANLEVVTGDVDQTREVDHYGDATTSYLWDAMGPVDWTIENPPFNHSFLIWKQAIKRSAVGVAFLNNITWIEPTKERGYAFQSHPPQRQLVLPRHSFKATEKSSNAPTTVSWFIWDARLRRDVNLSQIPPPILIGFDAKSY